MESVLELISEIEQYVDKKGNIKKMPAKPVVEELKTIHDLLVSFKFQSDREQACIKELKGELDDERHNANAIEFELGNKKAWSKFCERKLKSSPMPPAGSRLTKNNNSKTCARKTIFLANKKTG